MSKYGVIIGLMFLTFQAFAQNKKTNEPESKTDIPEQETIMYIDDDTHKNIQDFSDKKIGNLIWSRINLDVLTYRNGDSIPQAQSDEEWLECNKEKRGCWCYFESKKGQDNIKLILYNWYAVTDKRILAPEGYHIPGETDWNDLAAYYGGKKSCKTIGWGDFILRDSCTNINEEEFPMVNGGYRMLTSPYLFFGNYRVGEFWSVDAINDREVSVKMVRENLMADKTVEKGYGASVRCVKD